MNYDDIKPGDILIADDSFGCLNDGQACEVHTNADGELFVHCGDGTHFLDGQIDDDEGTIVGFTPAPAQ